MKATTQSADDTEVRLVGTERVCQLLGVTRSHVEHLRRSDLSFPVAVKLGSAFNSSIRFAEHEILAWIAARMAARESDAARHGARATAMAEELAARLKPGVRRGGRRKAESAPA